MLLPNLINLLGISLLLSAHLLLSLSDRKDRLAYTLSGTGAIIVAFGSYLIDSYPVLWLNIFWAALSFSRAAHHHTTQGRFLYFRDRLIDFFPIPMIALQLAVIFSLLLLIAGNVTWNADAFAYTGSALYLASYFALTARLINKSLYLIAGLIGYLMIAPHLIDVDSWSVLGNETLGAAIALLGLIRLSRGKKIPMTTH